MYNNTIQSLTNLPLNQFVKGQPLVIKFTVSPGYYGNCHAEFICLERGLVKVKLLNGWEPKYLRSWELEDMYPNRIARVRASNCYVWGKREEDKHERCHWFKDTKTPAT